MLIHNREVHSQEPGAAFDCNTFGDLSLLLLGFPHESGMTSFSYYASYS